MAEGRRSAVDVVYMQGPKHTDELRWSLRSLANMPHRHVWIVGVPPAWPDVRAIRVSQDGAPYDNVCANLRAAAGHPDVSDPFVLFNDDFFVIRPVDGPPNWHAGSLAEAAARYESRRDAYARGMRATAEHCGPDALSYALHVPMRLNKGAVIETLDTMPPGTLFRTVYGNQHRVGGTFQQDVKVKRSRADLPDGPFVSTSDRSFRAGRVGERLRAMFPDPSPYEPEVV